MPTFTKSATIPNLILKSEHKNLSELLFLSTGVALIALLAQVTIPLPFTPVPITGQTLGVSLVALSFGKYRAFFIMIIYILLGSLGLPIFAMGKSGFIIGPTAGYLIGMALASFWVGFLADKGYTNSFFKSFLASFSGSLIIFAIGLFILSFYVPKEQLLISGLLPFIPGDIIKNSFSAFVSWKIKSNVGATRYKK